MSLPENKLHLKAAHWVRISSQASAKRARITEAPLEVQNEA
jgi:hypothetical protein